jgi:CelD/BcsL family acetyltransferase involved in cellulose biosynthesis
MLLRARAEVDLAVSRMAAIDHFCSSSAWTLAADVAIMSPGRELYCRKGDHGWALLARRTHPAGWSCLESLEASWCLASPLALPHEHEARAFAEELAREWAESASRDVLFLSGIVAGSALFLGLLEALEQHYELTIDLLPPTRRFRASLDGGVEGFLSRRSSRFREHMRQAAKKAAAVGVVFEPVVVGSEVDAAALYARLLAVETRSWKGLLGDGLLAPSMQAFYREMLPMLASDGTIRAHVGRLDGEDVAVIVGAVTRTPDGAVYRGLQFSFDDAHRSLSLGNLAQMAQIRALTDEGVRLYDLGSEVEYKRRWGELCLETVTLVAVPRALRAVGAPGWDAVLDSPAR